jgi:hypothetical protein
MTKTEEQLEHILNAVKHLQNMVDGFNVELTEDDLRTTDIQNLAMIQRDLKTTLDAIGPAKSEIQKVFDFVRIGVMPERMDEESLDSMTVTGVGRVTLTADVFASVKKDMKPLAFEWLGDHGHGDLIQPTLNASSLKALAKRMLKDGDPLPEDYFNVSPVTRASITKV